MAPACPHRALKVSEMGLGLWSESNLALLLPRLRFLRGPGSSVSDFKSLGISRNSCPSFSCPAPVSLAAVLSLCPDSYPFMSAFLRPSAHSVKVFDWLQLSLESLGNF